MNDGLNNSDDVLLVKVLKQKFIKIDGI